VLPFADLSAEPGRDFLADGITDEIINALARLDGLRVASRTSSFALRHLPLDVRAVGARLGVQAVLEGSLQHEGRRLRVTARLVDTADGAQLWSERYDREFADVFAIQDEIAASIARALRLVLTERERRSMARVPTADLEAYEAYLRGRQFFHQRRRKSLQYARELFSHAIERDPAFAPAWAGIADCCSLLAVYYPGAGTDLLLADSASRRALELAPDLPEAHASRGFALWMLKRLEEAVREFEAALALDPRQFDALYFQARLRFQQGDAAAAARLFERAAEAREDYEARFFAAQSYATLGRAADAEAAYRRALAAAADHMALNPDDPRAATMRAVAHCRVGERPEGLRWAERAMQIDPDDAGVLYNVACLYALEGERERAIDCLERAVAQGFGNREWIARDPDLDPLRDDPRFRQLAGTPPRG
jgi:TolB-like protein/Flp pilus assembly protein TadD